MRQANTLVDGINVERSHHNEPDLEHMGNVNQYSWMDPVLKRMLMDPMPCFGPRDHTGTL